MLSRTNKFNPVGFFLSKRLLLRPISFSPFLSVSLTLILVHFEEKNYTCSHKHFLILYESAYHKCTLCNLITKTLQSLNYMQESNIYVKVMPRIPPIFFIFHTWIQLHCKSKMQKDTNNWLLRITFVIVIYAKYKKKISLYDNVPTL